MIFLKNLFNIRDLKYWCIICDVLLEVIQASPLQTIHSFAFSFSKLGSSIVPISFLRFSLILSVFFIHFILQRRSECSTKRKKYRKRKNAKHEGKSRPTHTHTYTECRSQWFPNTGPGYCNRFWSRYTANRRHWTKNSTAIYATDAPRSILLSDNDTLMERYYPSTVVILYRWTRRRGYYIVFEPFLISTYYTDLRTWHLNSSIRLCLRPTSTHT